MEALITDFSGGMNASAAPDKLKDNECLLAENVRFDEQGNVLITGANTLQNTSTLIGSVHSEFIDSVLGAIAGAGTNVYSGASFKALALSSVKNPQGSKMSFGAAPNRVYMDLSFVGYFKDTSLSSLVTVDWAPPPAFAVIAGPQIVGSGTTTQLNGSVNWTNPGNVTSVSTSSAATATFTGAFGISYGLDAKMGTNTFAVNTASTINGIAVTATWSGLVSGGQLNATLLKNGVPVGQVRFSPPTGGFTTATFGDIGDLWGSTWTPADVNSANFGVRFQIAEGVTGTVSICNVLITIYGGTTGTVAAAGASGTLTGTYTWKITFAAGGGEESDASGPTASVVLSAQQGTLTSIPVGDARTTTRKIYRKGGTLSSYYLVGQINDNVATTYSDNKTDLSALTDAILLAGDTVGDEPNTRLGSQQVRFPCLHYERVFWAVGNTLIWSKPLNGFAYPADFSTPIGDGKSITGIFSMAGELFILKPDTIWRMSGTDENSFVVSKTLSPVGTDWPFTAALSGGVATGFYTTGRIVFANSRGLWAFNGYTSNKMTPNLDLWFRQDDRTNVSLFGTSGFHPPEIVNSSAAALNCAAATPLFYYLAYAESGQSVPSAMLVFDLERGAISKRAFVAQSLVADPNTGYVYGGNAAGNIFQLDDWTASDAGAGANVNMDFQDKYRDFDLKGSRFALWGLEFMIATNGQNLTPTVYFDEGTSSEALSPISTPARQSAKVFRKLSVAASRLCRNVSFRLNYQGASANSGSIPNIRLVHVKAYFEPRGARARTGE